jgi:Ankyrin repeats (3 copies)
LYKKSNSPKINSIIVADKGISMLDFKFSVSEPENIEKFLLYRSQEKKEQKNSEMFSDTEQFSRLITQAALINQWKLVLLLLMAPPGKVSDHAIAYLAGYKNKIISETNLRYKTAYGQYLLTPDYMDKLTSAYIDSSQSGLTNLMRLAYYQQGLFTPKTFSFGARLTGSLGRIFLESQRRKLETRKTPNRQLLKEKNNRVMDLLVGAAKIDAVTASPAAKNDVAIFEKMLRDWFNKRDPDVYNPLFLIFEVFAMLADKGFDAKTAKKHHYPNIFVTTKIHFDSLKIGQSSNGEYHLKYALHLKKSPAEDKRNPEPLLWDPLWLLSTLLHEFIHHLLKLMAERMDVNLEEGLKNLVSLIKTYFATDSNPVAENCRIFNYFDQYREDQHTEELLPRLGEFYLWNSSLPDCQVFPLKIVSEINYLFATFLVEVARFREILITSQADRPSRVELFKHWEQGEYSKFFAELKSNGLNGANCRAVGFFPQFTKDFDVLKRVAAEGFPLNSPNKFGQTPLTVALQEKRLDIVALLLEKLRIDMQPLPDFQVNEQDGRGQTLLIHAIKNAQSEDFITWLIERCAADLTIADIHGKTARDYATAAGSMSREILFLLTERESRQRSPSECLIC